jgi:NAD(P)H-flavin reductase
MIRSLPADMKKTLYFTVATGAELFYLEKLQKIENLDTHIHVTKEEVAGCNFGRVDVDQIHAEDDTEWYLCGNPRMLTEAREKLQKRGFTSVYSEEFN